MLDNQKLNRLYLAILIAALFFYGRLILFNLLAIFIYILVVARVFTIHTKKRIKTGLIVCYSMLLPIQIIAFTAALFGGPNEGITYFIVRSIGILLLLVPFFLEKISTRSRYTEFAFPSQEEVGTVSFAFMEELKSTVTNRREDLSRLSSGASPGRIKQIVTDLPRHSSLRYINQGHLTEKYFRAAEASLTDPSLYIVVSNTGSPASEFINVFTQKNFNHVSLSFDRELTTIISYNGGERVYPPGLNQEMLTYFNQKSNASMMVYRLEASAEQKALLIDQVRRINDEGSAYNLIGLVFKYSHKPNIMFCSQFVYKMLQTAGLTYFEKNAAAVTPTDLIEQDYRRKLQFDREITFE